jgi:hypothetical protein
MRVIKGVALTALLTFAAATGALAADAQRGSSGAKSPSGHEGANLDKSRGPTMGGEQRGETSLKQEQRTKEDMERNKDKAGGKDPLEQHDPGPGTSRSGGVGAGQ